MCGVKLQSSGDTDAAEHLERLSAITGDGGGALSVHTAWRHPNQYFSSRESGKESQSLKGVSTILESQTSVQS